MLHFSLPITKGWMSYSPVSLPASELYDTGQMRSENPLVNLSVKQQATSLFISSVHKNLIGRDGRSEQKPD